jgi:lysophospholipase L1-like esterase
VRARRQLIIVLTGLLAVVLAAGGTVGVALSSTSGGPLARRMSRPSATVSSADLDDVGARAVHTVHREASSAPAPVAPALVVIGASYAAGVGARAPEQAWPQLLAQHLGYRLFVSGDPGAGYVNPGMGRRGPFDRLAAAVPMARINPAVIILQGGHNDIGAPLALVADRVVSLVSSLHHRFPDTRLVVMSVFTTGPATQAAEATDTTIVTAARLADPDVTVLDPLTGQWHFGHIADHLHPDPAGEIWLANHIGSRLERAGVERVAA